MILLDTNVLSALMHTSPDPVVLRWLDQQPAESIWTTSVTVFEVRMGLALLPDGRRQRAGRPVDMRDTQIAGIALARHAAVATRNVRHFGDLEVPVLHPWSGV